MGHSPSMWHGVLVTLCVLAVYRTQVSTTVSVKTANTAVIAKSKANKAQDVKNAMTAAGLGSVAVRPDPPSVVQKTLETRSRHTVCLSVHYAFENGLLRCSAGILRYTDKLTPTRRRSGLGIHYHYQILPSVSENLIV